MFETSWRRNDGVSLFHPFKTSLWRFNKTSSRRTTETSWQLSIGTSLGVLFETCSRRHGDVMMRRRCYVLLRRCYDVLIRRRRDAPLRPLGDVPLRRRWVFHLRRTGDVAWTYKETSLWRYHDVLMLDGMICYNPFELFNSCINIQNSFLFW